jgi:hypothetical protein
MAPLRGSFSPLAALVQSRESRQAVEAVAKEPLRDTAERERLFKEFMEWSRTKGRR